MIADAQPIKTKWKWFKKSEVGHDQIAALPDGQQRREIDKCEKLVEPQNQPTARLKEEPWEAVAAKVLAIGSAAQTVGPGG